MKIRLYIRLAIALGVVIIGVSGAAWNRPVPKDGWYWWVSIALGASLFYSALVEHRLARVERAYKDLVRFFK